MGWWLVTDVKRKRRTSKRPMRRTRTRTKMSQLEDFQKNALSEHLERMNRKLCRKQEHSLRTQIFDIFLVLLFLFKFLHLLLWFVNWTIHLNSLHFFQFTKFSVKLTQLNFQIVLIPEKLSANEKTSFRKANVWLAERTCGPSMFISIWTGARSKVHVDYT